MQHAQTQPEIESGRVTIAESAELPVIVRRTSFFERKLVRQALPWVVIAGMFVFWEIFVRVFQIQQFVLPAPSAIFAATVAMARADSRKFLANFDDHANRFRVRHRDRWNRRSRAWVVARHL